MCWLYFKRVNAASVPKRAATYCNAIEAGLEAYAPRNALDERKNEHEKCILTRSNLSTGVRGAQGAGRMEYRAGGRESPGKASDNRKIFGAQRHFSPLIDARVP